MLNFKRKKTVKQNNFSKITTVNDILTNDDLNDMINDLNEIKPHITDAIIIYMDKRDKRCHWTTTSETLSSTATWMLENVKFAMMDSDD